MSTSPISETTNPMAVLKHHRRNTFTTVDNTAIRDTQLSWKATGMLVYLLSLPDGWNVNETDLTSRKKDGRTAVHSALEELTEAGYVRKQRVRDKRGRMRTQIDIAENPDLFDLTDQQSTFDFPASENPQESLAETAGFTTSDFPASDKPTMEKPTVGKPAAKKEPQGTTPSGLLPTVVDHAEVTTEKASNPYFDAVALALDMPTRGDHERLFGMIAAKCKAGGHPPEEILRRVALHLATYNFPPTPGSIHKRWEELGSKVVTATDDERRKVADELDRMRRRQKAETLEATRRGLPA